MRRLIAICIFFYCGAAWSGVPDQVLECKNADGTPSDLQLSLKNEIFSIKGSERGCGSEYTYREASNKMGRALIFSAPGSDDLGLNAQNLIYSVSMGSKEARYIGSVPASATELEDGGYKDVQQYGGSIYESIYMIGEDKISILSPSKELVISGSQCIYQKEESKSCVKMKGSFKKPLCVLNHTERKVLVDAAVCSGMSENL